MGYLSKSKFFTPKNIVGYMRHKFNNTRVILMHDGEDYYLICKRLIGPRDIQETKLVFTPEAIEAIAAMYLSGNGPKCGKLIKE